MITYLLIASGENVYLSCVKDVATREIVAYKLSTDLRMDLVFQTMEKLEEHLQGNQHPEVMIPFGSRLALHPSELPATR